MSSYIRKKLSRNMCIYSYANVIISKNMVSRVSLSMKDICFVFLFACFSKWPILRDVAMYQHRLRYLKPCDRDKMTVIL